MLTYSSPPDHIVMLSIQILTLCGWQQWHCADIIFKCIFVNANACILILIPRFVLKNPINSKSALAHLMSLCPIRGRQSRKPVMAHSPNGYMRHWAAESWGTFYDFGTWIIDTRGIKMCPWRLDYDHKWQTSQDLQTITIVVSWHIINTYELVILRALKISILYKNDIFQCMGKMFCMKFQRFPFEIPHKISYPYIERWWFHTMLKIQELLDLRARKCFWNGPLAAICFGRVRKFRNSVNVGMMTSLNENIFRVTGLMCGPR